MLIALRRAKMAYLKTFAVIVTYLQPSAASRRRSFYRKFSMPVEFEERRGLDGHRGPKQPARRYE